MNATRYLTIRVTEAEYAALERAASSADLYLSEWARRLLFARAGLPVREARKPRGQYERPAKAATA
jgi:hypothetical protein